MTETMASAPATRKLTRCPTSWSARLSAVLVIAASPVATWWILGPNPGYAESDDRNIAPEEWDYLIHPPAVDPALERLVGIAAVAVFVIAGVVLLGAARRGRIDRRWWPPLLAMTLVGVIIGLAGRVMTAAVIGANIGGGFMLLFGTPVVLALAIGSIIWSIQTLRTTTPGRS